jgi:hypothetical protein
VVLAKRGAIQLGTTGELRFDLRNAAVASAAISQCNHGDGVSYVQDGTQRTSGLSVEFSENLGALLGQADPPRRPKSLLQGSLVELVYQHSTARGGSAQRLGIVVLRRLDQVLG